MNNCLANNKLTVVFPHIHYDKQWDIAQSGSLWSYFVNNNIVEPLIRIGSKTEYLPAIAKSWYISPDKKEVTFLIDDKYYFHNNEKIKIEDAYNSILRVLKLKITAHSDLGQAICDQKDCSKNITLEGNKLKIKLKTPMNGILFNFATPEYGIAPPEYLNKKNVDKIDLKNLSGPYQLTKFEKKKIELKAFTKHPLYSKNAVQKVDIIEIIDFKESLDYYKKNKDVVLVGSEYYSSTQLNKLEGQKFISSFALTEFIVPNRRRNVFKNEISLKDFSCILQEAKKKLKLDKSLAQLTDQLFTKDNLARIKTEKKTCKIKKYKKPIEMKMILFDWMKDSPIPSQLKELLTEYNINLKIAVTPLSESKKVIKDKDYDLLYIYSGVSALDPIVELIYLSKHPFPDMQYENSEMLTAIEKAKMETNHDKYVVLLKSIHRMMLDNFRLLPLFHTKMIYLTNSKYKIENMNHFDGSFDLWNWKK